MKEAITVRPYVDPREQLWHRGRKNEIDYRTYTLENDFRIDTRTYNTLVRPQELIRFFLLKYCDHIKNQ